VEESVGVSLGGWLVSDVVKRGTNTRVLVGEMDKTGETCTGVMLVAGPGGSNRELKRLHESSNTENNGQQ
jgi:hypothetical protein